MDSVITEFEYVFNSPGTNYINQKTTFAADPTGNSALIVQENRQYMDGLGKEIQRIQIAHSPAGKDVVTATKYDNQGRPNKQYEPIESPHSNGTFFAVHPDSAHTLSTYEASPLNRVKTITPPNWHPTTTEYGANTLADLVRDYNFVSASFDQNILYKTTTIDPNGNKSQVFRDFRGKTLLNRKSNADNSKENDTYTLFDLKERPKTIYPPGINTTSPEPELIYNYLYDPANNLLEKKIPGAAKMEYVYSVRDLQIAQRGGNLRADGKWLVTEFDDYGRPKKTGLNTSPTTVSELWAETFYDGFDGTSINTDPIYIGKIRKSKVNILDGRAVTTNAIESTFSYDLHGRIAQTTGNNHTSGSETNSNQYDFADNVVKRTQQHQAFNENRTLINRTTFDGQGRVKDAFHQIDNEAEQQISQLDYTVKDEVKTKHLGGVSGGFFAGD